MSILHLVVPGLLDPPDRGDPDLPRGLSRLFRGRSEPFPGAEGAEVLGRLFGLDAGPLPHAALSRLGMGLPVGDRGWFHADLVHLHADMDRLLLTTEDLDIQEAEAESLFALLGEHFAESGWRWEPGPAGRGWLGLTRVPRVATSSLDLVQGRAVHPFLPQGPEGRPWRALLNEAQMLLHQAPPNLARQTRGLPSLNGLWLWGGGRLPLAQGHRFDSVWGKGPLIAGLARLSGSPLTAQAGPEASLAGETLWFVEAPWRALVRNDVAAWRQALRDLDGALAGLSGRGWVHLYPCTGRRWIYHPRDRWRWWRNRPSGSGAFTVMV